MTHDQHPDPPQPPSRPNPHPGTDIPPGPSQGRPQADGPVPWAEFGRQVLTAHHRHGLGAQCICGRLMYHCPVIAAAQRLGLPTDEPHGHSYSDAAESDPRL